MSEGLFKRAKSLFGRGEPEPAPVVARKAPSRFHAVTIVPGRRACAGPAGQGLGGRFIWQEVGCAATYGSSRVSMRQP